MSAEIVPLPAATVTLVRDSARGPEVLMMQRNLKSGFVPGAHIFPGGALDQADDLPELRALCAGLTDTAPGVFDGFALGMGIGIPISPVEQTTTSIAPIPRWVATCSAAAWVVWKPSGPV